MLYKKFLGVKMKLFAEGQETKRWIRNPVPGLFCSNSYSENDLMEHPVASKGSVPSRCYKIHLNCQSKEEPKTEKKDQKRGIGNRVVGKQFNHDVIDHENGFRDFFEFMDVRDCRIHGFESLS